MMPGITGLEVLEVIRTRANMQELPVILLSALDSPEDIANGLSAGANDYMTKPANIRVFRKRVETQLTLKRMSDDHASMLATVQEASDFKNKLMRIASHDLRGPVQSLSLILDLLQEPLADDPENFDLLQRATQLAGSMEQMISDFLDVEVASARGLEVHIRQVNMTDVMDDIARTHLHVAAQKDVHMHIAMPDAHVYADPNRIRQVMNNLVSNAIKYTFPGTTISITGIENDDMLEIHIRDQGTGISDEEVRNLFQPFGKLSTRPTAGERSTGLGLWIVKNLVEAQNGVVYYDRTYTDGADFCVAFPLALPSPTVKSA